jgi:hypothetical protein
MKEAAKQPAVAGGVNHLSTIGKQKPGLKVMATTIDLETVIADLLDGQYKKPVGLGSIRDRFTFVKRVPAKLLLRNNRSFSCRIWNKRFAIAPITCGSLMVVAMEMPTHIG